MGKTKPGSGNMRDGGDGGHAELLSLELEAEPDVEYSDFHNDQPAFLLAKVDGDELAHLLESEHATPFDTPRMEEEQEGTPVGAEDDEEGRQQAMHNVMKPPTKVDRSLLVPGEADKDTETNRLAMGGAVEAQRTEAAMTQAAHRSRVDKADASLEGEWQQDEFSHAAAWSITHARILYTVSAFALESQFAHEDERESWLKELHLMVLIFEAIQGALLPFNKSPQWMHAVDKHGKTQKIWLNIAQEAIGFINDLCRRGFLHVLRVLTADGWTEVAYRCSKQGKQFVEKMPQKLKTQVDGVIRDPINGEPFLVGIHDTEIFLRTTSGFERQSLVTAIGRIPYVVSPYLAASVRHVDCELKSCADMAYQCKLWESEVPDDRDEAVVLAGVSLILIEWMLTGPNAIGMMVEALEGSAYTLAATKPVTFTNAQAGGAISMSLSKKSAGVDETKTRSTLIDFEPCMDVNFEAEILIQRDTQVRREQIFGVHVSHNGVVMSGVQVDAIQDREFDDVAPNLLATLLVELHSDSSIIIDPMISKIQRDVLNCLYDGNHMSRTKSVCIIADKIEPMLKASEFMDGGKYQKEFVQLVGEVHTCRDMVLILP